VVLGQSKFGRGLTRFTTPRFYSLAPSMGLTVAEPCILLTVSSETYANPMEHNRCWLAAYTRSRHENQVASQLSCKGVESLLPTYAKLSRWSDRIRRTQAPLFPGYVFVHVSDAERVPVLQTVGVLNLVSVGGKAARLSDEEIARLQACVTRPNEVEPHPYLKLGHRVRVEHGPFAGWEGILVQKQNAARLVIAVDQIMKSVAINLNGADVESVG
jgi:transcription antitermination factor NusG